MADLQVVFLKDMLKVRKVEPKLDSNFPALKITGAKLTAASSVLINGIEAPSFVPFGNNLIVAEIPANVSIVNSVAVLSRAIVSTDRSVIVLRLTGVSTKVQGILRLVQRFVLMLLTDPGSDIYHPDLGGGLRKIIARVVYKSDAGGVKASLQQSVDKTVKDLRSIQSKNSRLRPDERIVSANLLGVDFDPRTTTLAARIQLDSEAGQAAVANLFS